MQLEGRPVDEIRVLPHDEIELTKTDLMANASVEVLSLRSQHSARLGAAGAEDALARDLELGRRVRMRMVQPLTDLRQAHLRRHARAVTSVGVEVRWSNAVSQELLVVDRARALVMGTSVEGRNRAWVVAAPLLCDALHREASEIFRRASAPDWLSCHPFPDPFQSRLLQLMADGVDDRCAAKALGVSERTVGRQAARIAAAAGGRTRFHTAVLAVKNGWV